MRRCPNRQSAVYLYPPTNRSEPPRPSTPLSLSQVIYKTSTTLKTEEEQEQEEEEEEVWTTDWW